MSILLVETGLRVCANGHVPFIMLIIVKKMMIKTYSSSKPRTAQMVILSLVAMTRLEKKCMTVPIYCGYFPQVSEPRPVHLLFSLHVPFPAKIISPGPFVRALLTT